MGAGYLIQNRKESNRPIKGFASDTSAGQSSTLFSLYPASNHEEAWNNYRDRKGPEAPLTSVYHHGPLLSVELCRVDQLY